MPDPTSKALAFLCGKGEMARRTREHDWSATPLGPIESWSPSLKAAVAIMLASPGPVSVLWGPEHVQLYNDAYMSIAAGRHPASLGRPARETWMEAYDVVLSPIFNRVSQGEAVSIDDQVVCLRRADGPEMQERHFAASFSPIHDETCVVEGVWHTLVETTAKVRSDAALRESATRLRALTEASSDVLYRMAPDWGEMHELEGGDFLASIENPSRAWLMDYIPPEDHAEITAAIERAIAARAVFEFEHRVRRADGTIGWTLSRAVPILGPDGSIREWFGAATDVTERREAEAELRRANEMLERAKERAEEVARHATAVAVTDHLTGLANRRRTLHVLDEAVARARLNAGVLSVVVFDVDHFKRVNDTLGHAAGDAVLRRVARDASAALRAGDLVGRIGGEEFLLVLPSADQAEATAITERARQLIQAGGSSGSAIDPPVSASFGVATLSGAETAEALLGRADRALYEAKLAGRNTLRHAA